MQTMPSRPPRMLPIPFSSTPGTLSSSSPSRTAATADDTKNARNGWILPQLISSTSSTIDPITYISSTAEPLLSTHSFVFEDRSETRALHVQPDARQHVVRSQVQRLAVVAELAVCRGLAVADAPQTFAVLREDDDAPGTARENRAVGGDGEAVRQSGRVLRDEIGQVL